MILIRCLEYFDVKLDDCSIITKTEKGVDSRDFKIYYSIEINEHYLFLHWLTKLDKLRRGLELSVDDQEQCTTKIKFDGDITNELTKQFKEFVENELDSRESFSGDALLFETKLDVKDEYICLDIFEKIGKEMRLIKEIKIPIETETTDELHYTVYDVTGKEHTFECQVDDSAKSEVEIYNDIHVFKYTKSWQCMDMIHYSHIHADLSKTVNYSLKRD